ncbi:hypothetical protein HYV50_04195 [Candidatus Pacearchaeota archaeon]|nr:hypothetical protein [Candidatus Pacearchaeota archaeon]
MEKKLEITILIVTLIVVIAGTIYAIKTYYDQKESSNDISNKLDNLNKNLEKIVPNQPDIRIEAFAQRNFTGEEIKLYKIAGYFNCFENDILPIQNEGFYDRVLFFIENKGKAIKDLNIEVTCPSTSGTNSGIFAVCSTSEDAIVDNSSFLSFDARVYVPKLDSILTPSFSLFYLGEDDYKICSITYDSTDLSNAKTQTINLSYYLQNQVPSSLFS